MNNSTTTIYVSQKTGTPLHTGLLKEEPVESLETALQMVTERRKAGDVQPINIAILDAVYTITKPVTIGADVNRVTICGLNHTVISGGMRIHHFRRDTFNGKACFSATVPEIGEEFWFTDLYVDGERAEFTHLPRNGYFEPESVENNDGGLYETSRWFVACREDVQLFKELRNFNDCFISYYHYWVDEHSPVESFEPETGKVTMQYRSRFSVSDKNERSKLRYQLENVAEAFENKNEWYLDRASKRVYYIPRNEEQTPENIEVYAPVADQLFVIQGEENRKVEYITFENLTFAYTRGDYVSKVNGSRAYTVEGELIRETGEGYAADSQAVCYAHGSIELLHTRGCWVQNCTFRNLGLHGIAIERGCSLITLYGNDFYDLGAGAIKVNGGLFGCRKENETFGNVISQNKIRHCGRRYAAATGILLQHTHSNTVSHNDISDLFYTGISVGWVWGYEENIARDNIIEKNHIHHLGQGKLSDLGGVYLLGVQPGTVIRNNVIHHIESCHYGGHGIYLDEGAGDVLVENNICYGNKSTAFNQHFGRGNIIRNNIFVKSGQAPVRSSKEEPHVAFLLERNIIVSEGTPSYHTGYERQPKAFFHTISGHHNLHFNRQGETLLFDVEGKRYSLEDVQELFGYEEKSLIGDPMFCDYEQNDFRLQQSSPAFVLGFQPIDTSDVGVVIGQREELKNN